MVVTTKQTKVVEPPAPSRSSSSTATPKAAKRASLNPRPATSVPTHSAKETITDPNDTHGPPQPRNSLTVPTSGPFAEDARIIVSPKKSASPRKSGKGKPAKASNRSKKKKAKRMSQIIDLLTKIVFLLFSIYSLLVCPKDVQLESPVCRGLDYYRRTIVDPYILPPLRAAVTHPVVAPHIEKARPYVETTVETVKTRYLLVHDRAVVMAAPYVLQAKKEYNSRLRPHVRLMEYNIRRYRRQAEPYVQLFKIKSLQAWYRVEPHVLPILLKIQQVPALLQTFVAKPLEQGKEKWVDPQMKKIVDKVHEMSANAAGDKSASLDEAIIAAATPQEGTFATTDVPTYYSSPSEASPASITRRMRPTIIQTATAPSTNPPAEESPTETVVLAPKETVQTDGNAPPVDGTTDPLDQPLYNPNYDEDVEDIDFWLELDKWLSESVLPEGTVPASNAARPSPTRLTAQQKAEKKAKDKEETARKRKELTTKHDKWEKDLETLITKKQKELVSLLGKSRKAAVKELKALNLLSPLKLQLPNAIKTTKPWLAKMKANWEDNFGELDDGFIDKISRWSQIMEDVEWGFTRKKEALDAELSKWVIKTMEEESKAIKAASEEVKEFSKKAQSNLIEDYAMLWDVTHRDWENYHRFMFRGDEVSDQFQRLLNGDAASGASNPVNDELNRLQQDIAIITQEFKVEVDKIRKEGLKYILGDAMGDGTEGDTEGDVETPKDEKADPTAWDPEVSILPIDDSSEHILEGGEILLGKGKEQVQQAFQVAEEAAQEKQKSATHEEL